MRPHESACYTLGLPVFRALAKVLALVAALQILGGHWAMLQSVAWAKMIVSYAQNDSLGEAIDKTFSGEHPCNLCETVKRGVKEDKKRDPAGTLVKSEALLPARAELPLPGVVAWIYPGLDVVGSARTAAPPTPPPLA